MHTYSMQGCPRERYIFYISLMAIGGITIAKQAAGYFGVVISVGSAGVFGLLFFIFDRYLWHIPIISRVIGIPDLGGTWHVTGKTDGADEVERDWNGEVRIKQTWSHIAISLETENSRSRSTMASLERDIGHGFRVIYGYANEPKDTTDKLITHRGTCEVIFSPNLDSANALYFNDHQRRTCGTIAWKRI